MHRGYELESEIEGKFLVLENKTRQDPIFDTTKKIARTFRVPTSGMMASMPGDVITANSNFSNQYMIECKARCQSSKKKGKIFRLSMSWVIKNEQEAKKAGYIPIFVLSFKRVQKFRIWAILTSDVMDMFIIKAKKKIACYPNCINGKKAFTLVYNDLCKNPGIYHINNHFLVPFDFIFEGMKNENNRT